MTTLIQVLVGSLVENCSKDIEEAKLEVHTAKSCAKRLEGIRQLLSRKRTRLGAAEADFIKAQEVRGCLAAEVRKLEAEREVVELEYAAERQAPPW